MTTASNYEGKITPGWEVFGSDNSRIGTINETRGAYLKLDEPGQPDYWIARSDISSFSSGTLYVSYDKNSLPAHKVDESNVVNG